MIIKRGYAKLQGINTIAILADAGCRCGWKKNFPRLLNKVRKIYSPGLFIVAGDLVLNGSDSEYREILKYINRGKDELWAAVPGDHDRPLKNFRRYFGNTRKVIDVGKWRFIGVNTANRMFLKREAEWIDENIRNNTIIFSHVPPEAEGWKFHSLWPKSSERFLMVVKKHCKRIKAMYFGHIHGFSKRKFLGIPMTVTGAVAESKIANNNYSRSRGLLKMVIFHVNTGKTTICAMKQG